MRMRRKRNNSSKAVSSERSRGNERGTAVSKYKGPQKEFDLETLEGEDFGEVLRHEVNNPLTGILGNAELLLARRESLPTAAVERLETIAELAVRLRETIRRLSRAWESSASDVSRAESRGRHARSA